jgi:hypothetical protein
VISLLSRPNSLRYCSDIRSFSPVESIQGYNKWYAHLALIRYLTNCEMMITSSDNALHSISLLHWLKYLSKGISSRTQSPRKRQRCTRSKTYNHAFIITSQIEIIQPCLYPPPSSAAISSYPNSLPSSTSVKRNASPTSATK